MVEIEKEEKLKVGKNSNLADGVNQSLNGKGNENNNRANSSNHPCWCVV